MQRSRQAPKFIRELEAGGRRNSKVDTFKFPFQVPSSHDVTQNNGEGSDLSRAALSQPETFYKSKTGPVVLSVWVNPSK